MIRTKTIGKPDDLAGIELLEGIKVIRCTEDGGYGNLRSVLLEDVNGRQVEFLGGDSSNRINIVVPKPLEYITKYVVSGSIDGNEILSQMFESQNEADDFVTNTQAKEAPSMLKVTESQVEI